MPELGNSLADYDFYRNDRVKAAIEEQKKQPTPSLVDGMKAAYRTEMTLKSLVDNQAFTPDPNDTLTSDEMKSLTKDIPEQYHRHFVKGVSKAHREQIRADILQELKDNETLDQMGGTGVALRIGASLVDPPQMVASALTGGFGAAGKAGRLSRFVSGGLVAGSSNAAIEAYLNKQQYTRDGGDIAVAGLLGFGLGGLAGVFSKVEERAIRDAANRGTREIELSHIARTGPEMGVNLTPEGEALLGYSGGKLKKADIQIKLNTMMNEVFGAEVERAPIGLRLVVADMIKDGSKESLWEAKKLLKDQALKMSDDSTAGRELLAGQFRGLLAGKVDEANTAARGGQLLSKEEIIQQRIQRKLEESRSRTSDVANGMERRMQQLRNLQKDTEVESAFSQLKQAGTIKSADELIAKSMGKAGGGLNKMQRGMLESLIRNGDHEAAQKMARKFASEVLLDAHEAANRAAKAADEAKAAKAMEKFRERELAQGKADAQQTMNELNGVKGSLPKDIEAPPPVVEPVPSHRAGAVIHFLDKEGEELTGAIKKVSADGKKIVVEDIRTGKVHSVPAEHVTQTLVSPMDEALKKAEPLTKAQIDELGGQSVGAAQVKGTVIDNTDMMEIKIPGTDIKIPLRFDLFAITQRSEIPMLRSLGRVLFADSVGGVEKGRTAAELAEMDYRTFRGRWETAHHSNYEKWLLDNPTPQWKRQEAWLRFNEQVTDFKRGVPGEYHPSVKASAAHADSLMTELLAMAKKHGVQGAEDIESMKNYVTRRFDHDNIGVVMRDLAEHFGGDMEKARGAIEGMIAGAIRSVRDIDPAKASVIAAAYFKTVRSLRFNPLMNRAHLGEREYHMLREALKDPALKLSKDSIDDVMEMVTGKAKETSDAGNIPRFKARTVLDETFEIDVGGKTIKMSDLFDNNMDNLMNLYTKQLTGSVGMAKVGIKSHADFERMLQQARDYAADYKGFINDDKALKHLQYVEDGYKRIMGIPVDAETGTRWTRSLKILRDMNFFLRMGQAGFAQLAEIGNVLGQVGFRAFAQHTPALTELIQMAKGGHIEDQLGKDILHVWGIGAEMLNNPHMKELDNLSHSKGLARLENAAETAKWVTSRVSGLASVNNILHQVSYRMIVQKMLDQAMGGAEKLSVSQLKRLATAGLGDNHIDEVFANLKKYGKADEFGKVTQIDHEAWAKANPDNFELFRLAIFREARRAVQEHAVGETHPWMHTMLGQIIFQFRSFMLVSHAKQFLHGMAHMDSQTLAMWGFSSLFAGMAYVAQTSINNAGDDAALEKNLTPEKIGKASFARAGYSALMPMGADLVTHFTSYEPFFSGSRSSGLESAVTNPTFDLIRKYQNTLSNLGRSVFDSEYMATQQDIKDGLGGVLPNYLLVRNFINTVSGEYPKKNPMKQPME